MWTHWPTFWRLVSSYLSWGGAVVMFPAASRGPARSRRCTRRWSHACPSCPHKPGWPHTLLSGWEGQREAVIHAATGWRAALKRTMYMPLLPTSPAASGTTVQQPSSASPQPRPAASPQTNLHMCLHVCNCIDTQDVNRSIRIERECGDLTYNKWTVYYLSNLSPNLRGFIAKLWETCGLVIEAKWIKYITY